MEYKTIAWAPGKQYFDCGALHATLATDSCAANWRAAHDADDGRRSSCKGCRTGALHAGETAANLWQSRGQTICARCHQGSARLIRGDLCVSCYNREREFVRGINARGVYPSRMAPLHAHVLHVLEGGRPREVRRHLVADSVEVMVQLLRDSRERITFCFHAGQQPRGAQLPLF